VSRDGLKVHRFAGSHRDVGRAHGEELRAGVAESLALRVELCAGASRRAGREMSPAEVRELARAHLPHVAKFSPGLYEEIEGLAAGAGVAVEDVLMVSGYTDFKDVVGRAAGGEAGFDCTAFYAAPAATADGSTFAGQTWDMFADAERGVLGLHLAVHGEPEVFALAYAGCVGMMGMNAEGLALAANNLTPTDARPGVPWTFLCREILRHADVESAFAAMARARLCSGHNFLFADARGRGLSVETTGERFARIDPPEPTFVHANHYLDPALRKLQAPPDPKGCSPERQARLDEILRGARGRIDRAFLEKALADHQGHPRSVCCHDYEVTGGMKVRSCAALIMDPGRREIAVVKGNPCKGGFETLQLGC
jgi:isopenicillin-N N-acyltransferase-like protein